MERPTWHILMVDDDDEDYLITKSLLSQAAGRKIQLDWVETYEAGIERLKANHYDAVLVDYDLGTRTGIEFIREATTSYYPAPLILYTGRGSYKVDLEAMQAGAALYLTKGEGGTLQLERSIRYAIERIQTERALQESDRRLRFHVEHSPMAVVEWDSNFIVTRWAGEAERIFGWSEAEMVGRPIQELNLIYEPDLPIVQGVMEKLTSGVKRHVVSANRNVTKTGRVIHCEWYNSVFLDPYGNMASVMSQVLDITHRKQAEEALKNLARFPGENPNPVLRISGEGEILYANQASRELLHSWMTGEGGAAPEPVQEHVRKCLDGNCVQRAEVTVGPKTFSVTFAPIPENRYVNVYGADISDRKRAEQALRRYELLSSHSRDIILYLDRDNGRILEANAAATQAYGYSRAELLELTIHHLRAPGTRQLTAGQMAQADAEGILFETIHMRRDGHTFPVEVSSKGATIDGNRALISVIRDIIDRKRAEEALRASEAQSRAISEATFEGIIISENGRFLMVNDQFARMVGYSRDELLGRRIEMLHLPADREHILRRLNAGEEVQSDERIIRKDGVLIDVEVHGRTVQIEGRTLRYTAFRDITERKRFEAQLKTYSEQLERSNRELQEFAFVASHDLQEPLRKIEALGTSLLTVSADLDERQMDYVERMVQAAGRMRGMVDGLLALSRVATQGQPFLPITLSKVAAEVLSSLEMQLRRTGGQVHLEDLPTIEADPLQMHQLLQNLIGNALKYQKPDIPPVVKVSAARREPELVEILVEDQGIGFNESQVERIFQPFQRLVGRSEYEGSGMGLAICRKIVERHGGTISAQSAPGQGSVFSVRLPVKQSHTP